MQKRKIPVFYHIPKNAGTYVSDWILIALRYYRVAHTNWGGPKRNNGKENLKCLQIVEDGFIVGKLFIGDPNFFCDTYSKFIKKHSVTEWDINLKDLSLELLRSIFLFGIVIESNGFRQRKNILNLFSDYTLHQFLILRDPFSRAQSIYNYNKSEKSKHDYCHNLIQANSFEEYVLSDQLSDSWLIRMLTEAKSDISLNETHFNCTLDILKNFKLYDIKNADKAIEEAFLECYGFNTKQIILNPWDVITKNETPHKKIKFEELSLEAQNVFIKKTYWDNKLYNKLQNE